MLMARSQLHKEESGQNSELSVRSLSENDFGGRLEGGATISGRVAPQPREATA